VHSQDLLALLGRYNTDPVVEAALSHYAVRNRPEVKIDEHDADGLVVETQSWVKNSRAGIEFGFDDEAAWIGLDETQFGKRPMLLTQIYMYGQHDGVCPYQEPLPFGVELSDDRLTVRSKLQTLESTRHSHIRDTWDAPAFRMTAAFTGGDRSIDFIICMLREPPLPPLGYALQPVPTLATFIRVLGRPISDPEIGRVFDTFGFSDRLEAIHETSEADFRTPYGFALGFEPADEIAGQDGRQLTLSRVTLYQERELDGRGWPGELPYGLSFDDSPETAAKKVGRNADIQTDEDYAGHATWHEQGLTVQIMYSMMENRLARVSLIAP